MSNMLKFVTGSLIVVALASTSCKRGGDEQHKTEKQQVEIYDKIAVNFSSNQVENSDYEITTQVKCEHTNKSVVELNEQKITKLENKIAYFINTDYKCKILVKQIILKNENKTFTGNFSIDLTQGKSGAQFNSNPAGNTRYLFGEIGENIQTLSLELLEAQFAVGEVGENNGRFVKDPTTGLPKIDPTTGKPILNDLQATGGDKITADKQLAVTFNNSRAPETLKINYFIVKPNIVVDAQGKNISNSSNQKTTYNLSIENYDASDDRIQNCVIVSEDILKGITPDDIIAAYNKGKSEGIACNTFIFNKNNNWNPISNNLINLSKTYYMIYTSSQKGKNGYQVFPISKLSK
ncbi:hypothetical protein ACWNT8_01225 [Pigmentibacter ruber]